MSISTHVLDTSVGKPASGVVVIFDGLASDAWNEVARGTTDAEGRCRTLIAEGQALRQGLYRLRFNTKSYFAARGIASFYPHVDVTFEITDPNQHYHVPLLISPFGYSTYRGS